MFHGDKFMAFVGEKSGNSYAIGLKRIESLYDVDIDQEYDDDQCASLLAQIEQDKRRTDLDSRKLKQRSDAALHLKKYIEYMDNSDANDRRLQFVQWMGKQPRRDDPSKKYSGITIDAAAAKLQSGLKTLGIKQYAQTDCFSIASAAEFSVLYSVCYGAAEVSDKRQGHRDFRNGLDFYMQFLNDHNGTDIQPIDPLRDKIHKVIAAYKGNFEQADNDERYKWEAIGWYKQHWNIEAGDFAAMLETSFSRASNLLASAMYYPYRMLSGFAEEHPEEVRALFRVLHDETLPLAQRYVTFRSGFEKYMEELKDRSPGREKALQHYQDLRAVMVYLTFQFPEKYFLYKSTMYATFRDRVGFIEDKPAQKSVVWKVESYTKMCEIVLEEIRNDAELISMSKSRLDGSCYQDESFHLLTMDIVYYGSNYMSEADFKDQSDKIAAPVYWPSLEEYDPGLSKEDWKKYILEIEMPEHPAPMEMLKALMELGGEATCKKLAAIYGGTPSRYVGCSVNLGKRAKKYFDLPPCMEGDQERFFPIPFLGRYVKEDGAESYSYLIRPELHEALKEIDLSDVNPYFSEDGDAAIDKTAATDVGLNTILCGPPGTGKTYHTVIYAVAIIENRELASVEAEDHADVLKRYNNYKAQGRIEFTTFHQSYGYEEFIEGIKPVVSSDDETSDVQYSIQPGVFKRFCERAERPAAVETENYGIRDDPTVWKVSLWGTGDNDVRTECLKSGHIRIGWDQYGKDITDETDFSEDGGRVVLNSFISRIQIGDIVFSCYSASTIDAIGVVTGEYEWHDEYEYFRRLRKVKWIVKGIRENIIDINGGVSMTLASVYRLSNIAISDVYKIIDKYQPVPIAPVSGSRENYVFIIDEINRGNISKIFGELITLIETSKRIGQPECMTAMLPYSQKPFGVPKNVYIIGTMNTADRSIATIDTALRRRFFFKEMLPNAKVLADVSVEDLSISELLTRMNKRIEVLYDREHTIGHAYFMPLKDSPTVEILAEIFSNKIIPLLQEYFYEDYEKIRLVLGDNCKTDESEQFIIAKVNDYAELFGDADVGLDDGNSYEINKSAFDNIEAYRSI